MSNSNAQSKSTSDFGFAVLAVVLLIIGVSGGYFVGHQGIGATATSKTSTETTSMIETPVSGLPRPAVIPLVNGWYRGADLTYFDYGPNPNVADPLLAFFWQNGTAVAGQRNVIDTIPGQPGYSDFWRVYKVLVPTTYVTNSIRSIQEAMSSNYSLQLTDIIVNCPIVNPNTTVQGALMKPVQGWYRDRDVYYFDHGARSPASGFVVQTAPLYAFFWQNGTAVAGQRNVLALRPGDAGYSDLWNVTKVIVKGGYVPNTLRDVHNILAEATAGNVTLQAANVYVNCPVPP